MIKFSKLFETVYEPRSGDEKNFKDKHIIMKIKTPYDTESQFTSDKPKAKRKADQEDDVAVYEAAEVHTKRADKEPVIVQAIDPKTGQSRAKTVMRRAGEIKIEEVEQIDELSDDKLRDYHAKAGADRMKAKAEVEKGMSAKKFTPASVQKTADAYKRFVKRGKGMTLAANKMSEEVELEEGIDKMSSARLKFHAEKNFPHGSYTRKEIQDEHKRRMRVEPNYHTVKPALSEESDLDEKVVNPYAVGLAAAMKQTGDRPPLKKSTIIKGHEIAKGIQKEALDPVGKEDSDINNDGKVNKTDKYLKHRRNVIGRALQKEDNSLDQDNSSYSIYKKSNKPNPIKKNTEDTVKEDVDQLDELSKKTLGSYIKKSSEKVAAKSNHAGEIEGRGDSNITPAARSTLAKLNRKTVNGLVGISRATNRLTKEDLDLNESDVKYVIKHKKTKQVLNTHDDYATAKDEHEGLGDEKHEYGVYKQTKKDAALRNRSAYREEVEQIDELDRQRGSIINRYLSRTNPDYNTSKENAKRKAGRSMALNKKWGEGENAPKVAAVHREEVDLDEAERSSRYIGTVHTSDPDYDSKLKDLKSKTSGGSRVRGRDVKPEFKSLYRQGGKLHRFSSQDVKPEHSNRVDVYSKKDVKEEAEQIDELSKKTLGSYIKKAVPVHHKMANAYGDSLSKSGYTSDDRKWFRKKTANKRVGIERAVERLTKEDLDEAFKVGSMKLHDGSAVTLTKESVDALNSLFNQLNGANKAKMEERMMSGKKGFQEILSFAENI